MKIFLSAVLALATVLFVTGCAEEPVRTTTTTTHSSEVRAVY
jgi:hypothetical protein